MLKYLVLFAALTVSAYAQKDNFPVDPVGTIDPSADETRESQGLVEQTNQNLPGTICFKVEGFTEKDIDAGLFVGYFDGSTTHSTEITTTTSQLVTFKGIPLSGGIFTASYSNRKATINAWSVIVPDVLVAFSADPKELEADGRDVENERALYAKKYNRDTLRKASALRAQADEIEKIGLIQIDQQKVSRDR